MNRQDEFNQQSRNRDGILMSVKMLSLLVLVISFGLHVTKADGASTELGGLAHSVCTSFYGENCIYVGDQCGTVTANVEGSIGTGAIRIGAGGEAEFKCGVEGPIDEKEVEV